jgi:hypothetical protein
VRPRIRGVVELIRVEKSVRVFRHSRARRTGRRSRRLRTRSSIYNISSKYENPCRY